VVGIAHVRGGAELGQAWYEAGRLMNKRRSFEDFIDVTDHLVAERWAAPAKVFAQGGSAGGLLMGVVANEAGGRYRGMALDVPFVDVLTTMLDASIPLTANEWGQWGDPREKAAYAYLLSYSPYDNIAARDYPAMLVTTACGTRACSKSTPQYVHPQPQPRLLKQAAAPSCRPAALPPCPPTAATPWCAGWTTRRRPRTCAASARWTTSTTSRCCART
jgi:acetyl esterase/lipase